MENYKTVEAYIAKKIDWSPALNALREIIHRTELEETVKWGMPGYTFNNKNVVGISAFKSYVGLWFHQGVFLKDHAQKLVNAQEGKTKAMRQWRFHSLAEVEANKAFILSYLEEAIQNQKLGLEIKPERKTDAVSVPEELEKELKANEKLNQAFETLATGKKREYTDYITEAKREETKAKRLEKIIPLIHAGLGLHDKYK